MLSKPAVVRSSRHIFALLIAAALLSLGLSAGCDKAGDSADEAGATGGESGEASAEKSADQPADKSATKAGFDEAIADKPCELLSAKMVSETFGVPEGDLEQRGSRRACRYEWKDDTKQLEVSLFQPKVFESEDKAASYFGTATKNMTGEDVAEKMDRVVDDAKKKLDTKNKKAAAEKVGSAVTPKDGMTYKDIDGLGDEARLDVNSGTMKVRVSNLFFNLKAFHGASMEMPEKLDSKSIQAAGKKWQQENLPLRREAAKKLAPVVVENL
jgi:hypothetical protein